MRLVAIYEPDFAPVSPAHHDSDGDPYWLPAGWYLFDYDELDSRYAMPYGGPYPTRDAADRDKAACLAMHQEAAQ